MVLERLNGSFGGGEAFRAARRSSRSLKSKLAITERTRICTYGHNHKESEGGEQTAINVMKGEAIVLLRGGREGGECYSDEEVEEDENVANDNVDNHCRNQSDYGHACADDNGGLE